ncbi:hypothetical protein LCGC14_3009970, partial [marine sediment metagenome]
TLPMYAATLERAGKKIDLVGLTAYYDQLERENKAEAKAKKAKEGQDG